MDGPKSRIAIRSYNVFVCELQPGQERLAGVNTIVDARERYQPRK
jgi:hypothetical protein